MTQESYIISEDCIIISIADLDKNRAFLAINESIKDILYLNFEDWDDANDPTCISEDDANKIAEFVNRYNLKDKEFDLYVNCEAGQSRSAGVAAAISKFLFNDDSEIFRTKTPNMLCYRRVLNSLNS